MRFGFATLPVGHHTETVELVQLAERLGFHAAWMPDQTFFRDPYVTLTAVALATSRIILGLGVTNPYTRHPAMTARAGATLSEIAPGRFILGIGAGNRKELLDLLALPTDGAGQRCREAVLTIKQLLAGHIVRHESSTLVMRGIVLEMQPPPSTPVYLAARGPQILRAAGEVADGVIIGALVSDSSLTFALKHVRHGAAAAGRTLNQLEVVSWVTTIVTDRKTEIVEALKPTVAHIVGGAPPQVLDAIGIPQRRIEQIKAAYAEGGPRGAAPLIDPGLVDQLTLVGDGAAVAERVIFLRERGVNQIAVLMPTGRHGSHALAGFDVRQNLIRLAEKVLPRIG